MPAVDPGLQPHRTALAWHRTCLSLIVVSVATGFAAVRHGSPIGGIAALVVCGAAAVMGLRLIPRGGPRESTAGSIWGVLVGAAALAVTVGAIGAATAVWTVLSPPA